MWQEVQNLSMQAVAAPKRKKKTEEDAAASRNYLGAHTPMSSAHELQTG